MKVLRYNSISAAVWVVVLAAGSTHGAEIVLRPLVRSPEALIRLGDLAEIYSDDRHELETLRELELFPAPQPGTKRHLRVRELQDLLTQRGIDLRRHRLAGVSVVEIGQSVQEETAVAARVVSPVQSKRAVEMLRTAIGQYLNGRTGKDEPWHVELSLTTDQAAAVLDAGPAMQITGGQAPWLGAQQFSIAPRQGGAATAKVQAEVTLPPAVVVAVRSLPRGTIVRAGDVVLQRGNKPTAQAALFTSLEEVIGQETTQAVAAGQMMDTGDVRAPVVVRRGDVVTVYVRSAGLVVRTTARSRDDGASGDLVTVESLLNRQTFFARVVGIQEVEVYAHAAGGKSPAAGAVAATADSAGGKR
jgi:flagella basal body P-ring formation protein FlgA